MPATMDGTLLTTTGDGAGTIRTIVGDGDGTTLGDITVGAMPVTTDGDIHTTVGDTQDIMAGAAITITGTVLITTGDIMAGDMPTCQDEEDTIPVYRAQRFPLETVVTQADIEATVDDQTPHCPEITV